MKIILAAALAVTITGAASAQPAGFPGTATDIGKGDVDALAKSMSGMPGGDQLLRVAPINNGEYHVAVAVVHRAKATNIAASLAHHQITEVYHVISGSGTMVSGGTMENAKDTTDANILSVVGPSAQGGRIVGGFSRKIGAGDVVILPPDVPHGWTEVTDELVYLVVRMDPKKILKVK